MKNVLNKLFKIQQELKVPKNQRNTFGNYNFRNCEDIMEASKPICAKYNCLLTCSDELIQVGERYYVKATARLYDLDSGEVIIAEACAREEETKKGMDASQITGASSSYARKYALNGLLQLDDNKDADTNEFTKQQKSQTKATQSSTPKATVKPKVELMDEGQLQAIRILLAKNEELKKKTYDKLKIQHSEELLKKLSKTQATSLIKQLKEKVGE